MTRMPLHLRYRLTPNVNSSCILWVDWVYGFSVMMTLDVLSLSFLMYSGVTLLVVEYCRH